MQIQPHPIEPGDSGPFPIPKEPKPLKSSAEKVQEEFHKAEQAKP